MATTSALSAAGSFIATELAWHGSASDAWIAAKLAQAGHDVAAADVVAYAVHSGLLRPIPRLGGYTVTKRVNAAVFGARFAEWVAA